MPRYVTIDGISYEVIWDGKQDKNEECVSLIPDRVTKDTGFWEEAPRLYNKTGKYKGLFKRKDKPEPKIEDIRED